MDTNPAIPDEEVAMINKIREAVQKNINSTTSFSQLSDLSPITNCDLANNNTKF